MKRKRNLVWFVGSNPSRKNDDKMTPFYGTKSHLTLLAWIAALNVKEHRLSNASNEFFDDGKVKLTVKDYRRLADDYMDFHSYINVEDVKVVALGKIASQALSTLKIEHFRLPHPSPRNRQLNDPIFIDMELSKCAEYLGKK